jgi:hypothetical protein
MSDCHDNPGFCDECEEWDECQGDMIGDCIHNIDDGSRDAYE